MAINRYKQLLTSVPQGSFYESDGQVLPYRDSPYQLRFTTNAANRQYTVYLNENYYGVVNTNEEAVAIVTIQLDLGLNDVKLVDAVDASVTSAQITTRNYATLMASEAQVIEGVDTGIEQVLADSRIATVSAALIEDVFGQSVETANNMGYALDTYRDVLQELRTAYRHYGATAEGIARSIRAITQTNPLMYKRTVGPSWVLGKDLLSPHTDVSGGTFFTSTSPLNLQGTGSGFEIVEFSKDTGVGTGSLKWTASNSTISWRSQIGTTLNRYGPSVTIDANGTYTLYDATYTNPIVGEVGPYNIISGSNDKLKLNIDSKGDVVVTLTSGTSRTAAQVAADINAALSSAYGSLYNSVASSYNNALKLVTPTDGSETASIVVGVLHGSDAAQTLFNMPFIKAGLSNSHAGGVTTLQLHSSSDMTIWPKASFNNPLDVIIGRTTYQTYGGSTSTPAALTTATTATVVEIDVDAKKMTLSRELGFAQPATALVELAHQMPIASLAVVGKRSCTISVSDYTKMPTSDQTISVTISGTSLPDGWVLTGASARGPSMYSYFDSDRDMPIVLGAGATVLIPVPQELIQYAGYTMVFSVWGAPYDSTVASAVPEFMNISFDNAGSFDRYTPAVVGKTCKSTHKPIEYMVAAQVAPAAVKGYVQLVMSNTGGDFLLHRVRVTIPGIHSGLFMGDGSIPRNESQIKSGYFMYTWCADGLSTQEREVVGLTTVTQEKQGHIDKISPASLWLDKFDVSDGYNVRGVFTDAHFTSGEYENMNLVLRTPARFTYLEPLTFSTQDELVTWDTFSQYTLKYASDMNLLTSVLFLDGLPMDPDDWSYTSDNQILLNVDPIVGAEYRLKYNALLQFTSGTIDLGDRYAEYLWFADYDVYTRPEIIPAEVQLTTGVEFDSTGVATLVESSNEDQTVATLVQDDGTTQITVPISKWSFVDANHVLIDQTTFNPASLYTLTYTALSATPRNAGNVYAEIRQSSDINTLPNATWRPFRQNEVMGNSFRYYQIRLTLSGVRDTRDIRIKSALLKGLNMFGGGGSVPVIRRTNNNDQSLLIPIPIDFIEIVTPPTSVALGTTVQYQAIGHYSDGFTADWTNGVTWSTSDPSIATVDSHGFLTTHSQGVVTITATRNGVSASVTLQVVALVSLAISPLASSFFVGQTKQYSLIATFSDSSTADVTNLALWESSDTTLVSIGASTGLATAVKHGTVDITALYGGLSATTTLSSIRLLQSITVTPPALTLDDGTTQQYTATGHYNDGTTANITNSVTWASSNPTVASINGTGLVSALVHGSTNITATSFAVVGSTSLTVTTILLSIQITPNSLQLASHGTSYQLTATGYYRDGTTADLTALVTWEPNDAPYITVSSTGLVTSGDIGSQTVYATYDDVTGSIVVESVLALTSIEVVPANNSFESGATQQYTAIGHYSDGSDSDITSSVVWSSDNSSIASIDSTGMATGVADGTTSITATLGSVSGSTDVTVAPSLSLVPLVFNTGIQFPDTYRFSHSMAQLEDGRLIAGGGLDWNFLSLDTTEIIAANGLSSHQGPNFITPRYGDAPGGMLYPNKAVFIGGRDTTNAFIPTIEVFDGNTNTFSQLPGLWNGTKYVKIHKPAILEANGMVYVFGGLDRDQFETAIDNAWVITDDGTGNPTVFQLPPMPAPRAYARAVFLNRGASGQIMVVGGNGQQGGISDDPTTAFIYDLASDTWSQTSPSLVSHECSQNLGDPYADITIAAVVLPNGKVLCVGNGFNDGVSPVYAEIYDPATDTWAYTGNELGPLYEVWGGGWLAEDNNAYFLVEHNTGDGDPQPNYKIIRYNTSNHQWQECGSQAYTYEGRQGPTFGRLQNKPGHFIVFGGRGGFGNNWYYGLEYSHPVIWTESTNTLANTLNGQGGVTLSTGDVLIGDKVINGTTLAVTNTGSSQGYSDTSNPPSWHPDEPHIVYRSQVNAQTVARVEYYNTNTNTWTTGASFDEDPGGTHSYTLLMSSHIAIGNGKFLVAGGSSNPRCYIYDRSSNTWSQTGSLPAARIRMTMVRMANGNIMAIGGATSTSNQAGTAQSSVYIYVVASGTWVTVASMPYARVGHAALTLSDGRILVVGGQSIGNVEVGTCVIYSGGAWSTLGDDPDTVYSGTPSDHSLVELADGRVMYRSSSSGVRGSWIYDPATPSLIKWTLEPPPTETLNSDNLYPGRLFDSTNYTICVESKHNGTPTKFWTRPK